MKRLLSVGLCILLLFCGCTVWAQTDYATDLETDGPYRVGERVTVRVVLSGPAVYQAAGVHLLYDATAFSYIGATNGNSPLDGTVLFAAAGNRDSYCFEAVFSALKSGSYTFYAEEGILADITEWETPFNSLTVTVGEQSFDVNGDGLADTTDLLLLKQYLAGLTDSATLTPDVNGDGLADTLDLALLKKKLAGLI